ncbi:formate dehydrogenase accessory sulfurtransferase FdhD [Tessaracoccus antarcticus]|uniref:Sulfur carrier protein FdhD n=1 Tax=Tessaracoccus antarcticus TaxID=2479848 RepID=A0A3M0GF10_9ACTN|nr:formate dehydrogenase accessory sulfurtransferase FdhD [Tessaracoccus antarcticus]RMB61252.1 formate dehydrogenase accessory sulfurtransferase FdhD [Tessaracoccus antarcticus]
MKRAVVRWRVHTMSASGPARQRPDQLAGEEPMEIRLAGRPFSVTMRTPGQDFDLVAGFLLSEGVIWHPEQVSRMDFGTGIGADGLRDYNTVEVTLAPGVALPDISMQRHVYTSSSCGICGTASIEAVRKASHHDVMTDPFTVDVAEILALPTLLRAQQANFDRTGGVHAAALFTQDDSGHLRLVSSAEDVGRHNAVDKVLGGALLRGQLPLGGAVLQVSGRASFELAQKALMAGVPILSAVSAPSSLAVQLGAERGLTVVAFNNGRTLNVYTHEHRIRAAE